MKVGDVCVCERRFGFVADKAPPQHRYELKVTKVTPRRVYLGRVWFALDDPSRVLKPKYLDYRDLVVEVRESEKEGNTDG